MMLRDDAQAALNEVVVQCETAAGRYHDSARRLGDHRAARLFSLRGQQLQRTAAELGSDLRELDDLPSEPDPEREVLHGLVERLRESLAGDERNALLERWHADEQALLEALERAREQELPAAVRAHLERAAARTRHMLQRLEPLRAAR